MGTSLKSLSPRVPVLCGHNQDLGAGRPPCWEGFPLHDRENKLSFHSQEAQRGPPKLQEELNQSVHGKRTPLPQAWGPREPHALQGLELRLRGQTAVGVPVPGGALWSHLVPGLPHTPTD